jgi:hypothetical protein
MRGFLTGGVENSAALLGGLKIPLRRDKLRTPVALREVCTLDYVRRLYFGKFVYITAELTTDGASHPSDKIFGRLERGLAFEAADFLHPDLRELRERALETASVTVNHGDVGNGRNKRLLARRTFDRRDSFFLRHTF